MTPAPHAFGYKLTSLPKKEEKDPSAAAVSAGTYIFANALSWVSAHNLPQFKSALANAQKIFPDGIGTVIACKIHSNNSIQRVTGPDFTHASLQKWKSNSMLFIGGSHLGYLRILQIYNLSQSELFIPPYAPFSEAQTLNDLSHIKNKNPDIVWVCLGSPKQELWADFARLHLKNSKIFSVGNAFHVLSGEKKRAPLWIRSAGLEWAYRLAQEPFRLFNRCLIGNSMLLFLTIKYKITHRP